MTQFLIALAVFILLHTVPAIPGLRAGLIERFGRRNYLIAYSIVSLLTLAWVFHAAFKIDYVPLWDVQSWQAWVTLILTPLGLFFLIAGLITPNPASISLRGAGNGEVRGIVTISRHPVLWGFLFWAGSHLVPNGDLRSVLLFGALFVFAAMGIPLGEKRARRRLGAEWQALARKTSILPFAAILAGRASLRLDAALFIALAVSAVLTAWLLLGGHAVLFGADPLALALA